MMLLDLPDDVLGIIKSMTFVSYYHDEVMLEDYSDPLIRWYHNRLRSYCYNRFSEVCREVSLIPAPVRKNTQLC